MSAFRYRCVVDTDVTAFSRLNKQIIALRKELDAGSQLHRRRDLKELKPYVEKVQELMNEFGYPDDVAFDMETAWKGIVKERVQPKMEKPSLNVADLYVDLDSEEEEEL